MTQKSMNTQYGRIKLSSFITPEASDNEVEFLEQLGVPFAYTWMNDLADRYEDLADLQQRLALRGITLYNAGDLKVAKSLNIHLATKERNRDIERFAAMLETLSRLDINTTTFTWEPDHVWSTSYAASGRGRAVCRIVDERELEKVEVVHGRVFGKDEMWENFTYFMNKIIPVAESTGVRLALHPNDPPMPMIGGIATLINSYEDYRKAFDIAGSPYLGMEFCCGCWLEGGDRFGNIIESIKEFVREGRIFITHLRNISSPMPYFEETFLDNGYMDMFRIVEAFYEADYDGTMIYDHTPAMTAGKEADVAYAIGYMKAIMNTSFRKIKGLL